MLSTTETRSSSKALGRPSEIVVAIHRHVLNFDQSLQRMGARLRQPVNRRSRSFRNRRRFAETCAGLPDELQADRRSTSTPRRFGTLFNYRRLGSERELEYRWERVLTRADGPIRPN